MESINYASFIAFCFHSTLLFYKQRMFQEFVFFCKFTILKERESRERERERESCSFLNKWRVPEIHQLCSLRHAPRCHRLNDIR